MDEEIRKSNPVIAPNNPTQDLEMPYRGWETAGFGWRAAAYLIDGAIIALLGTIIFSILFRIFGELILGGDPVQFVHQMNTSISKEMVTAIVTLGVMVTLLPMITLVLYGILFEYSKFAATPGKLLLGLKVATVQGDTLFILDAVSRNTYKQLPYIISAVGVGGIVPIMVTSPLIFPIGIFLIFVSSIIAVGFFFVDPLYSLFNAERQTLHDKWSNCIVIEKPNARKGFGLFLGIILVLGCTALQSSIATFIIGDVVTDIVKIIMVEKGISLEQKSPLPVPTPTPVKSEPVISPQERLAEELEARKKEAEKLEEEKKEEEESGEKEGEKSASVEKAKEKEEKPKEKLPEIPEAKKAKKEEKEKPVEFKEYYGKSKYQPRPTPTPVREKVRGSIKIRNKTFSIRDAVASLSKDRKIVVLNLYDQAVSPLKKVSLQSDVRNALSDTAPIVRFKYAFSQHNKTCDSSAMFAYWIEINARKSNIPNPETFVSFKRSGNQILSQELMDFKCARVNGGYFEADLSGNTAFLKSGVRIPVYWSLKVTKKFLKNYKKGSKR